MIRGLMTDDEWAYFEPFLIRRRWPSAAQPSPRARRGVLVDANRRAVARSAGGIRQLEFDLSSIPSLGRQRRLGCDPGGARRQRTGRRDSADDRCDHRACASLRRRRKGGDERNALGRSRGGFSTKINARTNAEGLPIGIVITPGQAHDVTAVPALMHDIDCDPEQMLGDKGYDSEAVRQDIEQRGGEAVIPSIATPEDTTCRRQSALCPAQPHRAILQSRQELTSRRHPLRQTDRELRSLRAACLHPHLD